MTTALIFCAEPDLTESLKTDLEAAGIHVIGAAQRHTLVREAARFAPDVVIGRDDHPDQELLETLATLARVAPSPVVFFTQDGDADWIARGVSAGIHAYVVSGYAAARLRPLIQLALARFASEQSLRAQLADLANRLEERKLVDRAKGLLMQAGRLSEDEAFRLLRSASQRDQRRVGQVSRRLIDAARTAEAVNRSGQLRMLSQRIVKLQALIVAGTEAASASALLEQSKRRVRDNLDALSQLISSTTHGDLLQQLAKTWNRIEEALSAPLGRPDLAELDRLAEKLLQQGERTVSALEGADRSGSVRVVNLCGRQRMLSQRIAKDALLAVLLARVPGKADTTASEFQDALGELSATPDSGMREQLQMAMRCWQQLQDGVARAAQAEGRVALAAASEELLELFEQLTDRCEHSLPVLLGPAGRTANRAPDCGGSS